MKRVDTRGFLCPQPLIMTRRAISDTPDGGDFEVVVDNDTARCNLMSYLTEMGLAPVCREVFDEFFITFTVSESAPASFQSTKAESFCKPSVVETIKRGDYVVAIAGEFMGRGDDDLGALLMRGCVNSLFELDRLPRAVVMYNSGVKLAVRGSDTARSLEKLQDKGVMIICCGTCVDFFDLKDKLSVGKISNMLTINELLASADHIMYP